MALDPTNLKHIKLTGQPSEAFILAGAARGSRFVI
jgi:hypothetical protein